MILFFIVLHNNNNNNFVIHKQKPNCIIKNDMINKRKKEIMRPCGEI